MFKMDSRGGGCCIARNNTNGGSGGGGGGYAYDISKMNRILLRYRPIAPKPATSSGSTFNNSAEESVTKGGKGKRKAMRKESKITRRRKVSGNKQSPPVVTLQLIRESPEWKDCQASKYTSEGRFNSSSNGVGSLIKASTQGGGTNWLSLEKNEMMMRGGSVIISSWVKVESVAYTWLGDHPSWLGGSDNEKVMRLDQDTCPGFISGGGNRIGWVNRAYKEVFGGGGEEEVVVWLVLGDGVELGGMNSGGFTCKVRVVTCPEGVGKKSSSVTLPCDVWRMDFGGFAWRLDTKAALSLSR